MFRHWLIWIQCIKTDKHNMIAIGDKESEYHMDFLYCGNKFYNDKNNCVYKSYTFLLWWFSLRIHVFYLIIIIKFEVWPICHCLGLDHETMLCAVCVSIYIFIFFHIHWGRVTHICISKLPIISPDNGLSPSRRQAIIWTNAGILLTEPLGTSFSEILLEIHTFSFKKIHLKMSSGEWRPSCLGLSVLMIFSFIDVPLWVGDSYRSHLWHPLPYISIMVWVTSAKDYRVKSMMVTEYQHQGSFCICAQPMRDDVTL